MGFNSGFKGLRSW